MKERAGDEGEVRERVSPERYLRKTTVPAPLQRRVSVQLSPWHWPALAREAEVGTTQRRVNASEPLNEPPQSGEGRNPQADSDYTSALSETRI